LAIPFTPSSAEPVRLLQQAVPALGALLQGPTRAHLLRSAQALAIPTQTLCLECRLDADPRVDLALCLFSSPGPELPRALQELGPAHARAKEWRRARELLVAWAEGRMPALARVPFVCVAFDLESEAPELPVPCLSFCVDPDFLRRRLGFPLPPAEPASIHELAETIHAGLHGEALPEPCRARIRTCLAAEGVEARHISLMLVRKPATLKLDLALPSGLLARFLRGTGFQGEVEAIQARVERLVPWQRGVQLNYGLYPAPAAHLEVEFCTGSEADDLARRRELLDQLGAIGLVDPDKAQALLDLVREPVVGDLGELSVACNWYLKVRFEGGVPTAAKAYLGLMPRRVDANARRAAQPTAPNL
jgi:hypothetical protein